jgi:flavin-dependent dehydrogenase
MSAPDWDVIVLGAGPAGALAAHQLARRQLRVLMVEKRAFPRWKVCGSCLSIQALQALELAGLGDLPSGLGAIPLGSLRIGLEGQSTLLELPGGLALSRRRLDQGLVEAATAAGVQLMPRTEALVGGCSPHVRTVQLRSSDSEFSATARVVLVATGLGPAPLASPSLIRSRVDPGSRIGAGCEQEAPAQSYGTGTVHMAVGSHGYVGLVQLDGGRLNVAAAFDRPWLISVGGPAEAARRTLAEAGFAPLEVDSQGPWQMTAALSRHSAPLASHRLLLLGDAAGYVEPFTGEGIGWALHSGLAAVPLVLRGLSGWEAGLEREWERRTITLIRRQQRFCRLMAYALRRPLLRRSLLLAVSRLPSLTPALLRHRNGFPLRTAFL